MFYRFYHQFPSAWSASASASDSSKAASPATDEIFPPAEATEPLSAITQPEFCPLQSAGETHQGLQRENNEDCFYNDALRGVFMVCDGMGGHAAGEQASALAVEALQGHLCNASTQNLNAKYGPELLDEAFKAANKRIWQAAQAQPAWQGMGSTGVVALVHDGCLHLANVGDSRAYLWRGGELRLLTRDHSVAAELGLSTHEVREHPLRNRLTMTLGSERAVKPYYTAIDLQKGDIVLLCSDGLWDMLSDEEIATILAVGLTPQETVRLLIKAANAAGGHDNITVIVAHV